jgi:hypothetical protein
MNLLKLTLCISAVFLVSSITASAQDAARLTESFSCTFISNQSHAISSLLDESVEFDAPASKGVFSKEVAVKSFSNFLLKQKATGFELKHQGNSGQGQLYAIGHLNTESGQKFKVVMRARDQAGTYRIFQLNFTQL